MKKRWLLNLILIIVIILIVAFLLLRPATKPIPRVLLPKVVLQELTDIRILRRNHQQVVLHKVGTKWKVIKPVKARTNHHNVTRLLQIAQAQTSPEIASANKGKLKQYGLEQPQAQLWFNKERVDFGSPHPLNNQQYVRVKDNIYLIPAGYFRVIANPLNNMLDPRLLEDECRPSAFYLPGMVMQQQQGRWHIQPLRKNISADRINQFVKEWRYASALSVGLYSGKGMRDRVRLVCRTNNAVEKRGRHIAIEVLQYKPQLILHRRDNGLEYRFPAELAKRLLYPFRR